MTLLYFDELGNRVYPGGGSPGPSYPDDEEPEYPIGYTSKVGRLALMKGLEVDLAKQPCTIMCYAVYADLRTEEAVSVEKD